MRVTVDQDYCLGHGLCHAAAPQLFDLDDAGQSVVLIPGDIPASLEDDARAAAAGCPERAITIEA
jgi:ferredoxin